MLRRRGTRAALCVALAAGDGVVAVDAVLAAVWGYDPVALVAVILVAAVTDFTKGETERIWLPLVPLACVGAAARTIPRLGSVLLALAARALVVEALFGTVW
ncbi:MAG: hypothetical protein ACRDMX_12080 [Solirubrobacteraceae bacterium]